MGTIMMGSLGGGTGSGLTSRIVEVLNFLSYLIIFIWNHFTSIKGNE